MSTDKDLLIKGIKQLGYTVFLMFLAPLILYQAFKNEDHPLFIYVLIFGIIVTIAAIAYGFYGIKIIMDSLFNKKK